MSQHLNTPALDYIRKLYAPQDALLTSMSDMLRERNRSIQVYAEEARILQILIGLAGIKTIVEIGTLAGYSAICMARALPDDGHVYTIEHDAAYTELAQNFFDQSDVGHKITLIKGKAVTELETLNDKAPFDMMFIDADKINYITYLDWAEKHLRKGGLVVGDNTFLFGAVWQDTPPEGIAPTTWKNMRTFNERLADRTKYDGIIFPTIEGLSIARKLF